MACVLYRFVKQSDEMFLAFFNKHGEALWLWFISVNIYPPSLRPRKKATKWQMTYSNEFSRIKIVGFRCWHLLHVVYLTTKSLLLRVKNWHRTNDIYIHIIYTLLFVRQKHKQRLFYSVWSTSFSFHWSWEENDNGHTECYKKGVAYRYQATLMHMHSSAPKTELSQYGFLLILISFKHCSFKRNVNITQLLWWAVGIWIMKFLQMQDKDVQL